MDKSIIELRATNKGVEMSNKVIVESECADVGYIKNIAYNNKLLNIYHLLIVLLFFPHLRFVQMMLFPSHLHDILVRNKCSTHPYIHTIVFSRSIYRTKTFLNAATISLAET